MTSTRLKPIPGYGNELVDFNQIPVLKIADRVRRDILLPVLGGSQNSRFMRSINGSALITYNGVALDLLETQIGWVDDPEEPKLLTFATVGKFFGVILKENIGAVHTFAIETPSGATIKTCVFGDPYYWFACTDTVLYLRMSEPDIGAARYIVLQLG